MKKILMISSFLIVLLAVSMIGYHVVSANEKVEEIKDLIETQVEQETYLTPYGYTIENPNIILNPYGTSPLTAIILFETALPTPVTVKIEGKDKSSTIENTFEENTKHIIPIYGLYPNTENKIELSTPKTKKTYTIKTNPIESIDSTKVETFPNTLTILYQNNKLYGIDHNHDIRWIYTQDVENHPYQLKNGHLLTTTTNYQEHNLIEIDLMGKIYKQLPLENKLEDIQETEDHLLLLSDHLIELDWQTGTILSIHQLKEKYYKIVLSENDPDITLINANQECKINKNTKKQIITNQEHTISNSPLSIEFYPVSANYKLIKGIKYKNEEETPQSQTNIFLINYKKIDQNYKNYHINIQKTNDNITLTGDFKKEDKVYLILDKFLDKRIYDIKNNITFINQVGLSGKYSIYLKINNTIYKTDTYITV